ncbi:hypothetical protein [Streptomyces sp. NPDC088923]
MKDFFDLLGRAMLSTATTLRLFLLLLVPAVAVCLGAIVYLIARTK